MEVVPFEAVAELVSRIWCPRNARSVVVILADSVTLSCPRLHVTGPVPEQPGPRSLEAEINSKLPLKVWVKV